MITLANVTKRYHGRAAVDDLSLEVARGSICVLIGASGCGKSTTLRMINALVDPEAGQVMIDGRDVRSVDPADLRRRIGYVIQVGGLFPHWTVADNIATVPRLLGWPEGKVRARVADLLRLVGLEAGDLAGRLPSELSGGQQQRVGVARALAADPPVLLMDEPFGALDPATRRALQDELLRIHGSTGKTIVLVTHDMEEALKLGDRIVVMDAGRIVQDAPPARIVTHPANDLVRRLVGGEESVLRLLGRLTVAGAMRPGTPPVSEPSIAGDASLATALARLLVERPAALTVTDREGRPIGQVGVPDVAAALEP